MSSDHSHKHIWEKQPNETPKAYSAFQVYLELGSQRTVEATYRKVRGLGDGKRVASGQFIRWSQKYEWLTRAPAYDEHLALIALKAEAETIASEARKNAERKAAINSDALDLSKLMLKKARDILSLPHVKTVTEHEGKTVIINPINFKLSDAVRLVEVGDKLQRLSTDMATENISGQVEIMTDKVIDSVLSALESVLPEEHFFKAAEKLSEIVQRKNKQLS